MDNRTRSVWLVAISVVTLLLYIGGASGQTQIGGTVAPFRGMCFDAWLGKSDDGTRIRLHPCHGGPNQQWSSGPNNSIHGTVGQFQRMCFDAWLGKSDDGTPIALHPCHGGPNQQWSFASDGTIHGTVGQFQRMCFDAWLGKSDDGTPIALHPCHGGPNQRWALEPTPAPPVQSSTTIMLTAGWPFAQCGVY
jgi:hypothetical protein